MIMEKYSHMQLIFDNMPYLAWMKDKDGKYIEVNRAFENFCGKKNAEIIGKTAFDIFPNKMACEYKQVDDAIIKFKKSQFLDHVYKEGQAGNKWFDTYVVPILGENDEFNGTIGFSRKISKRKQLEIELQNQKRFIKTMLDAIPDLLFYKDINSVYLGCNKAFAQDFIGITEHEIIGKTDTDFVQDTELAKFFRNKDLAVFQADTTKANEEKITMADGSIVEVETVKTPFYDEQGKVAGLIGVSRDITSRKRLEQQLKESQERYSAIINSAPQIVLIHRNGIVKFMNDAGIEALAYKRENIIGSYVSRFMTDESLASFNAALLSRLRGESVGAYEIELIKKSREIMNVIVKGTNITYKGDQCTLSVLIDNTEKKKSEAKLRASEEKFRQLAENINEVFTIRDKEKILYISPAYEKITGRSIQSCLDNPQMMFEVIHPDDRSRMLESFVRGGKQLDQCASEEFRFILPNGEVGWALLRAYPMKDEAGNKQKAISIINITDRKRMEEQLRERERHIQRDLNLAALMQQDALPPPFSGAKVRANTVFVPCHTVSGDLVNYKWFEEQKKLRGYVVDVSGHGVATALQTATVKMLLDNRLLSGNEIGEDDFQYFNQRMLQYLYEESFAALLYFEFDFQTAILKVISAGINLFMVARPHECTLVPIFSGYLGMLDHAYVETQIMPFRAGEVFCLMSDGVSDLMETKGVRKLAGYENYLAWLRKLAQSPDRSDDFSAICIEIIREDQELKTFYIKNHLELQQAQQTISGFLKRTTPSCADMLEVAVNEAVNNGFRAGGSICVRVRRIGGKIIVRVKDNGPGFDTGEINAKLKRTMNDEDYDEEFDKLLMEESGRGILMMRMLCDRLIYNAKGNEVLLVKKI